MSYTKTNWKDGDVISAEKMNKIEQGIEDAGASVPQPIIFNATMDFKSGDVTNTSCNYTYEQIKEMSQNPTMPLTATIIIKNDGSIFGTVSGYSIEAYTGPDFITFSRVSYKQSNLKNDIITYHSDGSVNMSTSAIMTNDTDDSGKTGGTV